MSHERIPLFLYAVRRAVVAVISQQPFSTTQIETLSSLNSNNFNYLCNPIGEVLSAKIFDEPRLRLLYETSTCQVL